MYWPTARKIIESPSRTIQEKFDAEVGYWSEIPSILVGPLKKLEFQTYLNEAIDSRVNIHDPNISILDFGCGIGRAFEALSPSCKYVGVDISKGLLDIFKSSHPELSLILLKEQSIPFPDDSFNLIICYSVLTHIPMGEQCSFIMSELYRTLKNNGVLLVSVFVDVPNPHNANWIVYSKDDWNKILSEYPWKNHKQVQCYEWAPDMCQTLYTLIK